MKKKTLIVGLFLLVVTLGITYAWWNWTSSNTNVTFTIEGATITYSGGADITNIKLIPVSSKEVGETNGTGVAKTITASSNKTMYIDLNLDLVTFPNALAEESLVWEIYKGNTKINGGNFSGRQQGDSIKLFSEQEINSTTSTYKLYIWIDGTQTNPNTMQNQSFVFHLNASATDETPVFVNDKIIELAGNCTSWESGFSGVCATSAYEDNGVTKYHEYRYVGANVNNWVRFNNDDYRIIGVFDDNSHGVTGQYLIKLIAENPLGGYAWGATNKAPEYTTYSGYNGYNNNWETANANILLNEYFLNATGTSSTYKSCSDWTYYYSNNNYKTKDCSKIIGYGIQTTNLRNYIETVTWYLKGFDNSNSYSKADFYNCERGLTTGNTTKDSKCTSGNSGAYTASVTSKSVGLMYVSDYLYASGYYSSTDTSTAAKGYYGQQNWLHEGYEWTITPVGSTSNHAFCIVKGYVNYDDYTNMNYALRPTFYLKPTIKIKSGDGTFASPFIIG